MYKDVRLFVMHRQAGRLWLRSGLDASKRNKCRIKIFVYVDCVAASA